MIPQTASLTQQNFVSVPTLKYSNIYYYFLVVLLIATMLLLLLLFNVFFSIEVTSSNTKLNFLFKIKVQQFHFVYFALLNLSRRKCVMYLCSLEFLTD